MHLQTLLSILALGLAHRPSSTAAQCPTLPSPLPMATTLPIISALPSPFRFFNSTTHTLASPADWPCRRAELLALAQEYVYGYYPDRALENVSATRAGDTVSVTVAAGGKTARFAAALSFPPPPANASGPLPVVINTGGIDPAPFLASGVALATFNFTDVAADSPERSGAFWDLYCTRNTGVMTAWAWGFHRIIDALELVAPELDMSRIGVTGCSRWGKAALAAGIFDERVTLSMPMSSGLGGVGPWRFFFEADGANEQLHNIVTGRAWYWYSNRLPELAYDVRHLPFDAHLQAALVAPRAMVWDQGLSDAWSNPEGQASVTFPAVHAIYEWLGAGDKLGMALRDSGHCDLSGYSNIIDFVRKTFFNATITRNYTDVSPFTPYTQALPWLQDPPL